MSVHALARSSPRSGIGRELGKLGAFARRDLLVAWSYRMSFVTDLVGLAGMAILFSLVGGMVDPAKLPTYGGTQISYLEFAVVGLSLGLLMQVGLDRVGQAFRNEQLLGTLESLLMTPTSAATIQVGSIAYDLVYVPIRTGVFLLGCALAFGLHFEVSGVGPAVALFIAFVPFVWGVGVASAATVLTFRRGAGIIGLAVIALSLVSGVYFPIKLLPGWAAEIAELNPIAIAIDGLRDALLGGAGWGATLEVAGVLVLIGAVMLTAGFAAFRAALRRERRRGTLGLY
jgi:ABC-2 type transport system permease protein